MYVIIYILFFVLFEEISAGMVDEQLIEETYPELEREKYFRISGDI